MNKTTNTMSLNRQKKKRQPLLTLAVAMFLALFTQVAQAQTTSIYMRDGSTTIERSTGTIYFYDSHGPAAIPECWNYWYAHNEDFTYIFKPKTAGDKIKVTFNSFLCYNNDVEIGNWALRINDDHLYVYQGNGVNAANLIADLTGNTEQSFTMMADGAITFRFVSNARYREEGWYATVELVREDQGMQPQAPFIRRSSCHNAAELLATTLGAQIWYTTDGSDPRSSSTAELYKNEINFPVTGSLTVKAASKLDAESDVWSSVATTTFTDDDRIPVPGVPTITRDANTNVIVMTPAAVPANINETYIVRYTYTTNGTEPAEPDLTNSTLYVNPITCTSPNTWYKAKTFGLSCADWVSTETAQLQVSTIYCPEPSIHFGDDMFILANEAGVTYSILYTLDGSEPSLSPLNGTHSATTVSLAGIPYGTTVKALAFKMNGTDVDTQYQPSIVVSAIYVPTDENGDTQNGIYGSLVLIDDRENHSWSYYSDDTQPIHKLNPADIKITYSGNGTNNMTSPSENGANPTTFSENATNVHVNIDAPENQFVYLKTLERDNADGTGNLAYTTIPNPFQVRPIHHSSSKGAADSNSLATTDLDIDNSFVEMETVKAAAPLEMTVPALSDYIVRTSESDRGNSVITYEKVTASQSDWSGNYLLVYDYSSTVGYAFSGVNSSEYIGTYATVTKSNSGNSIESSGTAAILTLAPYSGNSSYYTIQINNGNYLLSAYDGFMTGASATNGTYTDSDNTTRNYYCYFNVSYSNGYINIYCPAWSSTYYIKFNISDNYFVETSSTSNYSFPNLYKQTNAGGSGNTDCVTEDFSGYTAASYSATTFSVPSGWNTYNSSSSGYAPRVSNSSSYTYINELTGNYLLMTTNAADQSAYAIMPHYDDITSVTFNYVYESTSNGTFTVGYVTTNSGYSTYTVLGTPTLSASQTTYSLSAANIATVNSANGYIAFRYVSTGSTFYSVGIDDVVVCTASVTTPSIVVNPSLASVITGNTVQLTATTTNATGAAITWSSNNPSVATVVTNSKDTSTATVTGVSAGAAVITASITVDGNTYTASSAITVADPSYCSPAPTSIDGTGIHPVVFGSGSEIVNSTSYPNSAPYYGDYSAMIGGYQQGATASVEITYNTGYSYGTLIWVDWDSSYTFDDDEVVAYGSVGSDNPITATYTFTIPANQAVGYYRMRIGAADSYFDTYIGNSGSSGDHDPCSTGTYKVFHDYTLHVTAAIEPPVAPVLSLASGTYTTEQDVTITCASSDAEIYYTTDGSLPSTSNGIQITSGSVVHISSTTTLRAIAYNGAYSEAVSATYYISTSGGGSLTCEDFESYSSSANASYNTAGSLPTGWGWVYTSHYHYNSSLAPHLYNGLLARDGVGIVMTAGYDEYAETGGSSSTYIGYSYFVTSNIVMEEGAAITFNTWVESTSYGTMTYGYMDDSYTFHSLGVANTAYYSGATSSDGVTTFTVPASAAGESLCFRWTYSTSTTGDNYSAVIDNVCQETTGAPTAPVFDLASGDYTGTQTVTITCSTSDAIIYYTTDGSEPSAATGTLIASGGTVTISTTTTLQAIAVNAHGASSITSATYTISQGASSTSDYRGFYAWRVKSLTNGLSIISKDGNTTYAVNSIIPAETDIQFVTDHAEGNEVEFEALWAQAYVTTSTNTTGLNANVGYERNFMVLGSNPGTNSTTTQWPTSTSTTYTGGSNLPIYQYSSSYLYSLTQQIYTPAQVGEAGRITQLAFNVRTSQNRSRTLQIYITKTSLNAVPTTTNSSNETVYRTIPIDVDNDLVFEGNFNFRTTGWNTITLTTPFEYDGSSNLVVSVFDNTNSAHSLSFYTYSSGGTRSCYYSDDHTPDLSQYLYYVDGTSTYNNQMRFVKSTSEVTALNMPLTMTTYNPDGTGGSSTVTLSNSIHAAADLKFENIRMNAIPVLSANGHNLVVGRGVTPSTTGGVCATYVKGLNANATSPNYKIRLESGTYTTVSMVDGYYGNASSLTISGTPKVSLVLGNDYDRATEKYTDGSMTISNNLNVTGAVAVGRALTIGSASMIGEETFKAWVKSGKICSSFSMENFNADFTKVLYMSSHGSDTYAGCRKLFIEGGEVSGVSGGMDACYTSTTANSHIKTLTVRMTNGHVRSAIYGGAAQVPSGGDKEIIVTGGVVTGWIGAGCNGTTDSDGQTYGEGFIYVGGDAISGGDGSSNLTNGVQGGVVFGAGAGRATSSTTGEMTFGTNVVIADECNVEHNVYGGGNYGYAEVQSNLYILGGTVQGNVFGGANQKKGPAVNITMKDGTVQGNIYGGSNTTGTVNGLATINISGGSVSNVFGGGLGASTVMDAGTDVTVNDGNVSGNVYGGGELGSVNGNTDITIAGGQVTDVFGAGKGGETTALVRGNTVVTVNNGTINGAVYGGGEAGNVGSELIDVSSTVTVSGGEVKGDVFGGGKMGTTDGSTFVNVTGGILRQNVFGGALGEHGSVFVGGPKTVNMMGGRVYGSVYGGSRNANDGNSLTLQDSDFDNSTETATTSVTNITGGQIDQHVYAAGYYGNTFGSVYAFIGLNAVQGAPNRNPNTGEANLEYVKNRILINGNVWAGGDWGTFAGTFGAPTVSGNSNIYVDGEGYSTEGNDPSVTNYMNIVGSVLGSGTSCDAGKGERTLLMRNYGADIANTGADADVNPFAYASRQGSSIQRFHNVIFDNSHLGFTGLGKVNSLNNTEKYALYEIDENVRVVNGSTLVMNAPSSQIKSFRSLTADDTYAATPIYTVVDYNGLGAIGGETDNKVRVNGGSYVEVRYFADPENPTEGEKSYGELEGFFHIMTSNDSDDATCAYARPKQSQEQGNIIPASEDNANDGGFVAYLGRYNQYSATGVLVAEGEQVQVRYENHTPNMRDNSEYFRIWRYGGNHHYLEGILNADATAEGDDYKTVSVTVQLPAWTGTDSYYRFDRTGTTSFNTLIDYGSDVLTYNAACYSDPTTGANWMYYDYENETQVIGVTTSDATLAANLNTGILDNPNLNYGLVITPGQAMSGNTYIINGDADEYLANLEKPFTCADNTQVPTITFTLTYSNNLTANMTWDPILVPLVLCSADGTITDYVTVALTINTSTEITSGFTTQIYAHMNGGTNIKETATVNVVLPTFNVAETGEMSQFTLVKAEFTPDQAIDPNTGDVAESGYDVTYLSKSYDAFNVNNFGLTIAAVSNPDNTDDWRFVTGEQEGNPGNGNPLSFDIGQAGGRSALTFGITLYYNSNVEVNSQTHMGDVTFTIGFTNFADGTGEEHYSEFTVTVEIYRIGSSKNFYVDGINGVDASDENRGKYPDKPAKTINYIFNRLGFLPGDNIFVVDNMPITKATTWDGSSFQNEVNVYRYPGGHALSGENPDFDNSPYLGALADVNRELTIRGITIDGMYAEATASDHNSTLYPDACTFDGEAEAPLITITEGGRVNLSSVTTLQNNFNANNANYGGAVNVAYGGILAMNMASAITGNINAHGGAVYMDGSMIVSDSIYVFNNYSSTALTQQNNVYLAQKTQGNFRVVQIGTSAADAYDALQLPIEETTLITKIGITKEDWSNTYEGYMPVVYAESGTESFLNNPYDNQSLIVHDGDIYSLERYVTDLHADSPLYLYWLGTWVTVQHWNPYFESEDAAGYTPYLTAQQLANISTPEQLAWVISLANGENGVDKTHADYLLDNVAITEDIDMSANIWVPIGNETTVFTGTFEGNGHVVSGITSPLNRTNMGMFGVTDGAVISDLVVYAQFNTTAANLGTVVGTMNGGVLSNVEGAGTLTNNYANGNTGGLVGVNAETTGIAGIIHSSFAVADIAGGHDVGGLVAVNNGNLINSYSNVVMTDANRMAGLVVTNNGLVENCYSVRQNDEIPAFAVENHGTINYCYFNKDTNEELNQVNYQPTGNGTLSYPGYYAMVPKTGTYGYMYYDNIVHDIDNNNTYVPAELTYANNQIDKWPGLLSVLNQWVKANSSSDMTYTSWLRPTSKDINSDLPVLCFPKDNCLGTTDGRYLHYSAYDEHDNGLDNLLSQFEDNTGYIFLYDDAKDVTKVPTANVNVFINEDAVLLQANDAGNFINANVGVSFDNSFKNANDYWGNTLAYDWHFLSTPLANAPLGISWSDGQVNWWDTENWDDAVGQVTGVSNSYLPDGTDHVGNWDFYSYYEPQYHWINFKRNSQSHAHYDGTHDWISYTNETELVPGKGYMAAIDKDSYLGNKGTLNGPAKTVSIDLTCSGTLPEVDDPTKDWGFNLLGNPYQAYLNMNNFLSANGLSSYWVYIAEQNKYVAGNVSASDNPNLPSATLHPHQAFFVRTTADKTVNFTYDMATADANAYSYFRDVKVNYPLVNLFAMNDDGQRDLAVIEFNRPNMGGSKKLNVLDNADFALSAHMGGDYSILFTEEGTDRVPVHFTTHNDGEFTLTWNTMHGHFTTLFLIDNKTGVRTDMLHNDHYTFNATTDDYASRFYITFRVNGVDDHTMGDGEEFAFFDGSEWVVDGQGQLDVIDVTGRVLQSQQLSGETSRIRLNNYAAGVYVLRITNAMTTKSQKIIIK